MLRGRAIGTRLGGQTDMTMSTTEKSLAQLGYEAYHAKMKHIRPGPLAWQYIPQLQRDAWAAVAASIIGTYEERKSHGSGLVGDVVFAGRQP